MDLFFISTTVLHYLYVCLYELGSNLNIGTVLR